PAPYGDLTLRVHVPHEVDLELLQRHADVRSDHVVNGPDLAEQIGRQRLVADRTGTECAGIDVFGFVHGYFTSPRRFAFSMPFLKHQPPGWHLPPCRHVPRRARCGSSRPWPWHELQPAGVIPSATPLNQSRPT